MIAKKPQVTKNKNSERWAHCFYFTTGFFGFFASFFLSCPFAIVCIISITVGDVLLVYDILFLSSLLGVNEG